MHVDDGVPLLLTHVEDHPVAQDAGDVDENVELAVLVERLAHHVLGGLVVGDAVAVGDRFAAGLFDLLDHFVGWSARRPCAVDVRAEVVDDDLRALSGHQLGDGCADAPARAGDNGNSPIKFAHFLPPRNVSRHSRLQRSRGR